LKASEVIKAYFQRIEEVNPLINAIVEIRREALREAEMIDKQVEEHISGTPNAKSIPLDDMYLLGVPISVKDAVAVENMVLTNGLCSRKNQIASKNAGVIENLRKAGAIPIASTNVPELLLWYDTDNKLFGRTNNPYDLSRTPGGSSGGEGALISSAGSVVGIGTDIGGSVRIPAAFCGIFGHKPTPGVLSNEGIFPQVKPHMGYLLTPGPMCRYVSDIIPTLKAMAGSKIEKLPKLETSVDLSKIKIYYMFETDIPLKTPLQSSVKVALLKVVSHFRTKFNVKCVEINSEEFNTSLALWTNAVHEASLIPFSHEIADNDTKVNFFIELIKNLFGYSNHTFKTIVVALQTNAHFKNRCDFSFISERIKELTSKFEKLLDEDGVFLYPSHPEVAPKHESTLFKQLNIDHTTLFNVLGVPVTQCPLGLNEEFLPIGLQIASNQFNDHLTIAVASEICNTFGGWISPSPILCN
ncbi:fatty-acid amide hydrolase 2-like protein, partial [Dinothrombium tinctorium]